MGRSAHLTIDLGEISRARKSWGSVFSVGGSFWREVTSGKMLRTLWER